MSLSILVVEDHELFAGGLKMILDTLPEFRFLGHLRNGKELVDFLEDKSSVDLIVLDL